MEPKAATELLARQMDRAERAPETLAADKGHQSAEVVGFCRVNGIKPHVATVKGRHVHGLDDRTTRTLGYQTSQKVRKRIEDIFGWCKEIGGLRRTRKHGTGRIGLSTLLILTSHNLVRMGKLLGSPPGNGLENEHGITHRAEDLRREQRTHQAAKVCAKKGLVLPALVQAAKRASQHSLKFIRCLRRSLRDKLTEHAALLQLRALYAKS